MDGAPGGVGLLARGGGFGAPGAAGADGGLGAEGAFGADGAEGGLGAAGGVAPAGDGGFGGPAGDGGFGGAAGAPEVAFGTSIRSVALRSSKSSLPAPGLSGTLILTVGRLSPPGASLGLGGSVIRTVSFFGVAPEASGEGLSWGDSSAIRELPVEGYVFYVTVIFLCQQHSPKRQRELFRQAAIPEC